MSGLAAPPAPDAGSTLLGHYGLQNPMIAWLAARHPELLMESPSEFRRRNGGSQARARAAPVCGTVTETSTPIGGFSVIEACNEPMRWRYDQKTGRPVWKCYEHDPPVARRHRRAKSAMARADREAARSLRTMLREALAGQVYDIRYDASTRRWERVRLA